MQFQRLVIITFDFKDEENYPFFLKKKDVRFLLLLYTFRSRHCVIAWASVTQG